MSGSPVTPVGVGQYIANSLTLLNITRVVGYDVTDMTSVIVDTPLQSISGNRIVYVSPFAEWSGADRNLDEREGIGEMAWQKTLERERNVERRVEERERSGELA
jgi:hypothetical protein